MSQWHIKWILLLLYFVFSFFHIVYTYQHGIVCESVRMCVWWTSVPSRGNSCFTPSVPRVGSRSDRDKMLIEDQWKIYIPNGKKQAANIDLDIIL